MKQFRKIHKGTKDFASMTHKACYKFDAAETTLDKIDATYESHIKHIAQKMHKWDSQMQQQITESCNG
jgi:hypothetical protein